MEHKFIVSSSPHIHQKKSVSDIMLDVIIALIPATLIGIYFFGMRAALVVLTAIASCVLSEYIFQKALKKTVTIGDLSAVVTGLLLGLNLPSTIPFWMVVIGSVFAIVLVKQLYGGIGKNFLNPALAARCFMLAAWAGAMTLFADPLSGTDAISQATPLSILKGISTGEIPSVSDAFFGKIPGTIGETSTFMLLLGGLYLLFKRVINWKIPVFYLGTVALMTALFGNNQFDIDLMSYVALELCCGGVMLAAIFMATDYTTTPTTKAGQIIFGIGCGVLTFVIRVFGGYPEGSSFAILLMNLLTPLIDRYTVPKSFGEVRKNA
jgi:electron transport complex protein RnfD